MPLALDLLVALLAGGLAAAFVPYPRSGLVAARRTLFAVAIVGAVVTAVLALLVRSVPAVQHLDDRVARWSYDHRTAASTGGLRVITHLGGIWVIVVLAVALGIVETVRRRDRWCVPFLLAVVAGIALVTPALKVLVDRARPALVPAAAKLGPAFPSGHSSNAAAFYAAAALLLGRELPSGGRRALVGAAVAVAAAVAVSRVLLDLHWITDVLAGLALGWGWFALCAAIFARRLETLP